MTKYPFYPVITNFKEEAWYISEAVTSGFRFNMLETHFGAYESGRWSTYAFTNSTTQNLDNGQALRPGTRNELAFTYSADNFSNVKFTYDVATSKYHGE